MGITPQQFEQMKRRLGAGSSKSKEKISAPLAAAPRARAAQVVLGVDPSLRGTGFGVVRADRGKVEALAFGTVVCPAKWEHSRCLLKIFESIRDVVRRHQPSVCVIEGLFFAQNLQTALIMGEARGASLTAAAEGGLTVYEIAPRKVKQAIVGYGAAGKLAVATMVKRMLNLAELPSADAADALALALVYAQEQDGYNLAARKKI